MNSFVRNLLMCTLVLAFVLSTTLQPSYACGPFSRYAIFSYSKHPDLPLDKYTRGEIGILQTSYARSYLYVAYRLISGGSFTKQEQDALSGLWNERIDSNSSTEESDSRPDWIAARAKVAGIGPKPDLEVNRAKGKDAYDYFLNCHPDAFKNAAKTLEERIAKFGAASVEVKEWTTAQDQVFSNCGGGQSIPEQSASTDSVIKADRAYQIAAAHFYAMNFDDARTHFERISSDSSSPWHEQARYLVARSLIRKASLGDDADRVKTLNQAETVLKQVVSENKKDPLHVSASGLLDLVELRLRPAERIRELAQVLVNPRPNENLKQDLLDYRILLDKYTGDSDQPLDENLKTALDASDKDDLTEWLLMFQSDKDTSLLRSIGNWERTHSRPWLIASLSKVDAANKNSSSIVSEAERIEPASPAFLTAQFHILRLLIEKGDSNGARGRLDSLLTTESTMPSSAVNQFRHLRMTLATDLNDFLKFALRKPAAFAWDEDGTEAPINVKEDDELKSWADRALLDVDSTSLLNERFPLTLLRDAAASSVLPEHVRRQIALAAWTRAVALDDVEAGKAIAPLAIVLAPELKTNFDAYLSATTREARQSAALYAILKFPGLKPYVDSSTGRLTPLGERDIYRDNWWCDNSPSTNSPDNSDENTEEAAPEDKPVKPSVPVRLVFLNDSQASKAAGEYAKLLALGTAPNYLARETIEWAKRTPNDPRVPEALHLVVTTTRYGCTDKDSPKWSKAAFDLLHKRYPQSIWAKKTPYWFKDV